MKGKQNVKYVTLDITTRLSHEDLTRLINHLKILDDFSFLLRSEIFTDSNAEKVEKRKSERMMLGSDIPHRVFST
jgi:hypothetical protein